MTTSETYEVESAGYRCEALDIPGAAFGAARASESHHPSRSEAIEHPGAGDRRKGDAEDHRFRRSEGPYSETHRRYGVHPSWRDRRDPGIHEPGAGAVVGRGHRYAYGRVLVGDRVLRVADRRAAAGTTEDRLRRVSAALTGGRAAEAEHEDPNAGCGDVDGAGAEAAIGAGGVSEAVAGGPGLDCAEGAGEGPGAAVRLSSGVRRRYRAVLAERGGAGRAALDGISDAEIRAAAPGGSGYGGGICVGAGSGGGHQHSGEHPGKPGSGGGAGGEWFLAKRSAGAGERGGAIGTGDEAGSGSESSDRPGPRSVPNRRQGAG